MKEREALAEQPAKPKEKAEYAKGFVDGFDECVKQTQPPQRTWVGLTPEEVDSLANLKVDGAYLSVPDTIRQTDAKLKEKNT